MIQVTPKKQTLKERMAMRIVNSRVLNISLKLTALSVCSSQKESL